MFSCELFKFLRTPLFYRTLQMAASGKNFWNPKIPSVDILS